MCQTNTFFDWTCSDKINTVFPRKEARAPPISYCGLFVGAIGKSGRGQQTWTRTTDVYTDPSFILLLLIIIV